MSRESELKETEQLIREEMKDKKSFKKLKEVTVAEDFSYMNTNEAVRWNAGNPEVGARLHENSPMWANTNSLNTNNTVFGNRLVNIDQPLNATSLAVINNASNSYFETAGEMYLNGSIKNPVAYLIGGFKVNPVNGIIINNKPSVIYLGSITCVFCGENR